MTGSLEFPMFRIALLLALCSPLSIRGLKIPFERYYAPDEALSSREFGALRGDSYTFAATHAEAIDNKQDLRYTTNITINGKEVPVALDTGSTDLWVNAPGGLGSFNDTKIPLQLKYGDGSYGVSGTIGVSSFKFSVYEVPMQAFLHATTVTINLLKDLDIHGLLGLSFDLVTASPINAAIKRRYGNSATWGQSVLRNIFDQNPTKPNLISLALSRTDDLEDTKGGSFTIGEYDPKYPAITEAPKLPQYPVGGDRWTTLLQGIYVDGNSVPVTSSITGVPAGRAQALLDTGDPKATFPPAAWNAVYSRIPGSAKYSDTSGTVWIIPCNTTAIVELALGGLKYPIHPLDLTIISDPIELNGKEYIACVSAIRGQDVASSGFEYSLGDSFLRNVYTVYNFGDSTSDGKPYMQLLSRIDTNKAVSQVTSIRMKALASRPQELPPAALIKLLDSNLPPTTSTDPTSATSKPDARFAAEVSSSNPGSVDESVKKYGLATVGLLAANAVIGLVLLVFAVLNFMRKGSERRNGVRTTEGGATLYVPIKGQIDEDYDSATKQRS